MSEEEVKDILRNRGQKIKTIHEKMLSLHQELEQTELLSSIALPALKMDGMPGGKGGHKDLGDVLLNYKRQFFNRDEEIRKIMCELVKEEESIGRVWACFHALNDPYYSILHELYVGNQLYLQVEQSYDVSHKTFEKYRQRGLELLIRYYDSGESIARLMHRHRSEGGASNIKKKKISNQKGKEYDQLSLSVFLKEEK